MERVMRKKPIWQLILGDALMTGLILCVFALFHHVIPMYKAFEPVEELVSTGEMASFADGKEWAEVFTEEPVFDELVDRIMSIIRALSAEPDKIILTGGGAKLHGLDQALAPLLCLPVEVCRDSENAVIRGIAKLMSDKKKKK